MFDEEKFYYIGSWRRCAFDASVMPQCICRSGPHGIRLSGFDHGQNLFRIRHVGGDRRRVILETISELTGKVDGYLSKTARVVSGSSEAGVWEVSPVEPFRNGPMDIACQLRESSSGKLLCSREKSGEIFVADEDAENMRIGDCAANIAWEMTPDCDEAVGGDLGNDMPDWLRDMLSAA